MIQIYIYMYIYECDAYNLLQNEEIQRLEISTGKRRKWKMVTIQSRYNKLAAKPSDSETIASKF